MSDSSQLIYRIEKAKKGSVEEREKLLQEYLPFIAATVSDFTGRYVTIEGCEEFTVAMMAMDEAIDSYDSEKGTLVALARTMIRNRLIDQRRKDSSAAIPVDDEVLKTIGSGRDLVDESILRREIEAFENELLVYGIDFEELVDTNPTHWDTILKLKKLAREIGNNEAIVEEMQRTKVLPIRLIRKYFDVSAKVLRSHKSYIVALVLANRSDSETIQYYVRTKEV